MEIKGTYKLSGSVGVGLKILVSGRELDELGNVKYPYSRYSGQEYYVATPGKKLEKIKIAQYDPSNEGHFLQIFNPWGDAYKFTSTSPYSKDWEFDIAFEVWRKNQVLGFFDKWENNLLSHNTGRGEDNWSEFKEINYIEGVPFSEQPNYNAYAQMSPIGKGQFVGPGLTDINIFYLERDENNNIASQLTNAPFCFYSREDGFTQTDFNTTQSYTFTTATNTERFWFNTGDVLPPHATNVFGNQINIAPKIYQLSKDVFLLPETYSLTGSRILGGFNEPDIISGTFSYVNYNAFGGLRNATQAFVLKVTAQLGEKISGSTPVKFHNQIDSQVLQVDLLTGETNIICEYRTTLEQRPSSYFQAGMANIFLPSFFGDGDSEIQNLTVASVSNIHIDVLPKFMFAVFRDAKNSVLAGNIVYYVSEVIGLQNPEEILTKDYQLKIQKFNINDLSSYEETIIQVERSHQSVVPSQPQNILGIQYHPSF